MDMVFLNLLLKIDAFLLHSHIRNCCLNFLLDLVKLTGYLASGVIVTSSSIGRSPRTKTFFYDQHTQKNYYYQLKTFLPHSPSDHEKRESTSNPTP